MKIISKVLAYSKTRRMIFGHDRMMKPIESRLLRHNLGKERKAHKLTYKCKRIHHSGKQPNSQLNYIFSMDVMARFCMRELKGK